ncbi:peptidoglycan DD-metalloendopeptidase family protein [Paraburkholderia acidiphila]|uniref:Peptidoglycan DD-metalloendopeptidase family protein n=1 Tax=Paraburkholderia acidiphila TaxID=2571747 RepID=A0A7Z2GE00_9BURK|nr:peptidoglycan DD-metalloendopeptidase family protein [Paraburkholderia acidiphila]QGZ60016.1 peptidoglycan DD-metalloendopeptidase family protein [Paraburkholderia acidiphila]
MKQRCTPTRLRVWRWRASAAGALVTVGLLSGCVAQKPFNMPSYEAGTCVSAAAGYYCVQPGDSLDSIAASFGRRPGEIAQWNAMESASSVRAGQMLRVGPPSGVASIRAAPALAAARPESAENRFVWPAAGTVVREFGAQGSRGIEIAGRPGAPVKAVDGGRIIYAGNKLKQYGLMVIVKHDDHFVTAYGNNRRLMVAEGASVPRGTTIAEMGVGRDGQPLLQFEMREDGRPVDPLAYLPPGSGPVTP